MRSIVKYTNQYLHFLRCPALSAINFNILLFSVLIWRSLSFSIYVISIASKHCSVKLHCQKICVADLRLFQTVRKVFARAEKTKNTEFMQEQLPKKVSCTPVKKIFERFKFLAEFSNDFCTLFVWVQVLKKYQSIGYFWRFLRFALFENVKFFTTVSKKNRD